MLILSLSVLESDQDLTVSFYHQGQYDLVFEDVPAVRYRNSLVEADLFHRYHHR